MLNGMSSYRKFLEVICGEMHRVLPFYLVTEVDMAAAEALRRDFVHAGRHVTYTAMVLKAISRGIAELRVRYPVLNAHYLRFPFRRLIPARELKAAVMVAREVCGEDYVFAGTVSDPQVMGLERISSLLAEFAEARPDGTPEFRDQLRFSRLPLFLQRVLFFAMRNLAGVRAKYHGTFGLTTVGKFGPDIQIPPTMNPVSFAFGSIRQRVVAVDGCAEVRPAMFLTVTSDRRVLNGAPGAQLLMRIRQILEAADFGERPMPSRAPAPERREPACV